MIGQTLSRYEILEKLGEGGMGAVYRARDPTLQRDVALKILFGQVANDSGHLGRFRHEARALASLSHPNIVSVFSVEEADGHEFITMELVDGEPLTDLIPPEGLDLERFLRVALPIVSAVAAAHQKRVTHRDLKPDNVMVGNGGAVKVLDFGLAKRDIGEDQSAGGTEPPRVPGPETSEVVTLLQQGVPEKSLAVAGQLAGTIPYMAPELWRDSPADARSDVFALGVLLYELLAGRRPFAGATALSLLARILIDEPIPLTAIRKDVPARLDRIIRACLEKESADRPQAAEVLAALKELETARIAKPLVGRSQRRAFLVAIPLVVALAVLVGRPLLTSRQADEIVAAELVSDAPGLHERPSLAPDGATMAFVSDETGVSQIYVTGPGQGRVRVTNEPLGATGPAWSPTGDRILYSRLVGGIVSISPTGDDPELLVEGGLNPSWNADASSFAFERDNDIWIARSNGSGQRRLDQVPRSNFADLGRRPALSPDGEWVAYFHPALGPNGDYWIAAVDADGLRRVTFDLTLGGAPAWTPDGKGLIVSSARTGSLNLWWVPVEGGEPVSLTTGAGEDGDPVVSQAGTSLAYANVRRFFRIIEFDPETGQKRVVLEQRTEIPFPNYSPDGRRIVFFKREGTSGVHIFTIAADGSDLRQVTSEPGQINAMASWSPIGDSIYFYRSVPDTGFYRVSAEGGTPVRVADLNLEFQPATRRSPDGRFFVVTQANGWLPLETTVVDATDPSRVVSTLSVPLRTPEWTRDGTQLLGWERDNTITVCPTDGGACERLAEGQDPAWSGDESEIFFLRPLEDPFMMEVWRMSRSGSNQRPVGRLGPHRGFDLDFDVGPGNRLLWHETEAGLSEIWLAEVR